MSIEPIVSAPSLICLVGGASLETTALSEIFSQVDAFIGVDGGVNHLLRAGIQPEAVIGDLDSISHEARHVHAAILCHISEQSTTDFEKALTRVAAPLVLAIGFTGGRMDHTLSVLNVMARSAERAIVLVSAEDASFVAALGETRFAVPEGARVSVMPLGLATVSLSGVRWPFAKMLMAPAGFTSPSNVAVGGAVHLQTDGPVLVTLPRAHLQTALKAAARAE